MDKYSDKDHYLDEETGVFKNKLGLKNQESLEKFEADCAQNRSYELSRNPIEGNFDLDHLRAIHRKLFGDVYEWAGEIRDVDIAKGGSLFALHPHINSAAKPIFKQLEKDNYLAGLDAPAFSERAAHYLGEINALHPFREGNGRTQREFINHLAQRNGYVIEWDGMSREDMLTASVESFQQGDNTQFAALIGANIQTREAAQGLSPQAHAKREQDAAAALGETATLESVDEEQTLAQSGGQRPDNVSRLAAASSQSAFALGDSARVTQVSPSGPMPESDSGKRNRKIAPRIKRPSKSATAEVAKGEERAAAPNHQGNESQPARLPEARAERAGEATAKGAQAAPQAPTPALAPPVADGAAATAARAVDAGLEMAGQALEVAGNVLEGLLGLGSAPPAPPSKADIQKNQAHAEAQADTREEAMAKARKEIRQLRENERQRQEQEERQGQSRGRSLKRERDE